MGESYSTVAEICKSAEKCGGTLCCCSSDTVGCCSSETRGNCSSGVFGCCVTGVSICVCVSSQVFTVTAFVQRAAGAPTALSPVTVRTELPALQMKGPVSVLQDTEGPPAREVSPALAYSSHLTSRIKQLLISLTMSLLYFCSCTCHTQSAQIDSTQFC